VLVGHAVQGDLNVLKLSHPKDKIRDTGLYEPFRTKYSAGKMPALKKVVQGELDVSIQEGEHDPVFPPLNISRNSRGRSRMLKLRWRCLELLGWIMRRRLGWDNCMGLDRKWRALSLSQWTRQRTSKAMDEKPV
jgi:hypothetical protein